MPNALKQFAADQRNIMYLVDKAAAAYPLELFHDAFADGDEPIAVRASVIRQLLISRDDSTPTTPASVTNWRPSWSGARPKAVRRLISEAHYKTFRGRLFETSPWGLPRQICDEGW